MAALRSLHLPAEVWANVILYVDDNKDLVALVQTCRAIQREAERALYRHLSVNRGSLLLEQLAILPPRLADHVHSLATGSEVLSNPATSQENEQIRQGLVRLQNLKSLHTSRSTYLRASPHFPFRLVELISWSDLDDVKSFFASQPSIKSLWWNPRVEPEDTDELEDDTLPNLETLQTDSQDVIFLLLAPSSRRRVTRLAIVNWNRDSAPLTFQCPFVQALRFSNSLSVVKTLRLETIFTNLSFLECHVDFHPVSPIIKLTISLIQDTVKVPPPDAPFIFQLESLRKWKLWNIGNTPLTTEWTARFGEIIKKHPSLCEIEVYKSIKEYLGLGYVERISVRRSDADGGESGPPAVYTSWGRHWEGCRDEWKSWS